MSLCLARAIDGAGGWSRRDAADALVAWLRAGPLDVGSTCRRGIRRLHAGGTLEGTPQDGDAGNGAAMRMVPVALLALGDRSSSTGSPWSRAAHAPQPALGRRLPARRRARPARLPRAVAAPAPRRRGRARRGRAALPLRALPGLATGYVVDTLQTALHFFFATRSFEECLVAVVNQGGDADTTAAIAGAIAGAYHGPEAIPRRWLRRLDRGVADGDRRGSPDASSRCRRWAARRRRRSREHAPHARLPADRDPLPLAAQDRAREEVGGQEHAR